MAFFLFIRFILSLYCLAFYFFWWCSDFIKNIQNKLCVFVFSPPVVTKIVLTTMEFEIFSIMTSLVYRQLYTVTVNSLHTHTHSYGFLYFYCLK